MTASVPAAASAAAPVRRRIADARPAEPGAAPPSRRRDQSHARAQVLQALAQDHQVIRRGMRNFMRLDAQHDLAERARLVTMVCDLLQDHGALEQSLFYATARRSVVDADLVIAAQVEHDVLDGLMRRLRSMEPDDERLGPAFLLLCDYFRHHVKEEEGKLFRRLARAPIDWAAMLERMQTERLARSSQWDGDTTSPDAAADPPAPRRAVRATPVAVPQ